MAASRPGNPDRGWNDPPMFLYKPENQAQQSPKRTALTQRVGMPQNYPNLAKTDSPNKTKTLLPTSGPAAKGPPPAGPPPTGPPPFTAPPPYTSKGPPPPSTTSQSGDVSQVDKEELPVDLCETTLAKLNAVLQSCQEKIQKRIFDDVNKKLAIFHNCWSNDKLSKPVKQRMGKLAEALHNRQYDEANEIHLSLMVDYVAEVSQWMVGVKRLIFEAKKHLPHIDIKENNDSKQSVEETKLSKSEEESDISKSGSAEETTDSKSEAEKESKAGSVEKTIVSASEAEGKSDEETSVSKSVDEGESSISKLESAEETAVSKSEMEEDIKETTHSKEKPQTDIAEDITTNCESSEQ
ncbi:steroid receptor RNA activator 1-like [Amphiura filiformis]|uniref:steroid receptor RNA activator 1-like n=1 Tax=Amphiura filiformis TaxID=82378 RepID=UPI003B20F44D